MPTVYEIEQAIFQWAPKETAMPGDNVGHLIGDSAMPVQRVLVALDIVEDVVREAVDGDFDLIVSHHPIMNCTWSPVQTIRDDGEQGRMFLSLIRNNVSAICMHTNLDAAVGGVNDVFASKLGLRNVCVMEGGEGVVRTGEMANEMPLHQFLQTVKIALLPNGIRYVDGGKPVSKVAVGGGACGEFFACAAAQGCDTFVTSDIKYNQFLDAKALGLNLIDAGHFPTEDPVCEAVIQYLSERFPQLTIQKSISHKEIIQYCL